jgi:hypothetical protein
LIHLFCGSESLGASLGGHPSCRWFPAVHARTV